MAHVRREREALLFLGLLALLPRVHLLGLGKPFWPDEDWTLEAGFMSLGSLLWRTATEDFHPPLGYLILGLWGRFLALFGVENEVPLRLLPVLVGASVPLLLYRSLREGGVPLPYALFGSLAYALIPQGIVQDVEFRMYPLAAFWVALSLWGSLGGKPRMWAWGTLLALWTHYLAGVVAFSLGLRFGNAKILLWPVAGFLPWVPFALLQMTKVNEVAHWNGTPGERLVEVGQLLGSVAEPVLLVLGLGYWTLGLLGLLGRQNLLPVVLAVGLLFLLGFQPVSPRYLPPLLPLLAYGAALFASRLGPIGYLLLFWPLAWAYLLPWAVVAYWKTYWPTF
ncbi:hypothetical protein [Thermus sp.]|uniref:hypothetical protein n=1 Tax=Thermus sp. TaxID=275 RepID=UPI0026301FEB|nr:hypothetical protein [Thermus sp.]MCX7849668.1 hypothetical protein [Thermus sp.]